MAASVPGWVPGRLWTTPVLPETVGKLSAPTWRGWTRQGLGALFECSGIVHGRLKVLGPIHLDVHANVVRKATVEKLRPL